MPTVQTFVIDANEIKARPIATGLHITATPIGNLGDITLRALNTLAAADLIFCEDTRVSARLLSRFQITTPLKPYHDHNGAKIRPLIIAAINTGQAIALISDAGTPLISDPGYKLVCELRELDLPVHMSPGVSAPVMALALSGFPTDKFQFCGFFPPKSAARKKTLDQAQCYDGVSLFFESPKRIKKCLTDIAELMPDAQISIGRELTKKYEEVLRGTAEQILNILSHRQAIKGEMTLAIWPAKPKAIEPDDDDVLAALKIAVQTMPAAKAALSVAHKFNLQKRQLYESAVQFAARNRK